MSYIGIGIITRNRKDIFENTYRHINKYAPTDTKIVVVDDNSNVAINSDFRFKSQVGIATATNKCFELLEDCDNIFIFNDDCFPIDYKIFESYINSGHNHLSFSFEEDAFGNRLSDEVYVRSVLRNINIFNHPNGCMLYLKNKVLKICGGFDTNFGIWGLEHVEFSNRVYNHGLIPYPYMDINNSLDLLCSLDYYRAVESSVPNNTRNTHINRNMEYFNKVKNIKRFVPWK